MVAQGLGRRGMREAKAWWYSKLPLTHGARALLKTSEAERDISTPAPETLEILLHDASPSPPFGVF